MRRAILALAALGLVIATPSFAQYRPAARDNSTAIYAPVLEKANQGDASSQYVIGMRYERGLGVKQSYDTANEWFLKATAQNLAAAQLRMGDHYQYGKGVKVDLRQAAAWYRKAANQNNTAGQHALGRLYLTGDGVKQDFPEAYFWLSLAGQDKQYAGDRDRAASLLKPEQIAAAKARVEKWLKDAKK